MRAFSASRLRSLLEDRMLELFHFHEHRNHARELEAHLASRVLLQSQSTALGTVPVKLSPKEFPDARAVGRVGVHFLLRIGPRRKEIMIDGVADMDLNFLCE